MEKLNATSRLSADREAGSPATKPDSFHYRLTKELQSRFLPREIWG